MSARVRAGLGYALWDAGVGLGIWLALNRDKVAGKRVLELGSGVGIGGVTAALVGAEAVSVVSLPLFAVLHIMSENPY